MMASISIARPTVLLPVFFFKGAATTEIYTLSLHDALPILRGAHLPRRTVIRWPHAALGGGDRSVLRRRVLVDRDGRRRHERREQRKRRKFRQFHHRGDLGRRHGHGIAGIFAVSAASAGRVA